MPLHVEQARVLVQVGALRFTERPKPRLLWDPAMQHHGRSDAARNGDLFITKVPIRSFPGWIAIPLPTLMVSWSCSVLR